MNKMLTHLNGYKREAVLAPLFKMLEATFDLFVPLVMADIVNVGIAAHDFHYILVRCGILLLLAVVGLACSLTAQYFSAKAAVGYSTSLRHALFEHIQRLGFTEMDTMGTSTLITRMTSDINQVQSGLNLFLRLFLHSAAAPLFQPAQAAGQGGFSRSVMPNDCGCTAKGEFHLVNVQGFRLMLIGKGELPDFPFGVPGPAVRQRYPL